MIFIQTKKESPKKTKKYPFAVFVDDPTGLATEAFANMVRSRNLKASLKNRLCCTNLSSLSFGDWVIFGTDRYYDFEITSSEFVISNRKVVNVYSLLAQSDEVIEALEGYINRNKEKAKKSVIEEIDEIEININIREVEAPKPKPRRVVSSLIYTAEPVTVHDNFVKVGYDLFKVKKDSITGRKYVKIDGSVYLIEEDSSGNKYLA